ncbi:transposable element Tcb2 transposase [Trichonephila clavipes]|nr:transposable element Tcb2 transposase [Trichonephila clavipes]
MINGRTRLHVVANGTMTGQRYIDEVLLPHVRLFRGAVGDTFVFMDDNATYLNPIENVWDALGKQVSGRTYPPTNKNTLICALTEEWDKLPQQLLDNVVQSMDPELFLETGSAGRRLATTPNEDHYLVLTARRHQNINATLLQQHLRSATGTTVSTQTVRNRLHGFGLYARRPLSRFSVHPDNRRIFIWRYHGSRNNPAFVHESVRFGGGGVLVYGGISIDGRTLLYIIRDGPMTARRYRDEILRPIVVPYAATIRYDFILMDDNSIPHHANVLENSLYEKGIFDRGSIVGFHLCGKSVREVTDILQKPKSTVRDVIVKCKSRVGETAEKRAGRPKILGERIRSTLKRVVKQNRKSPLAEISQEFQSLSGISVSSRVVHRDLKNLGFHGRAAAHKPDIIPQHAKHRLQW